MKKVGKVLVKNITGSSNDGVLFMMESNDSRIGNSYAVLSGGLHSLKKGLFTANGTTYKVLPDWSLKEYGAYKEWIKGLE